jgi:hypothetical protein
MRLVPYLPYMAVGQEYTLPLKVLHIEARYDSANGH